MSNQEVNVQTVVAKSKKRMRILLLLSGLFGVSILGSAYAWAGKGDQKTFSVEPGTVLEIYNKNGSIDVSSWDRDYIEIISNKKSGIDISTGKKFVVRTSDKMNLRITVPKGVLIARVENSTAGNINVENVSGDVDAYSSSGNIKILGVTGFVKGKTNIGKIFITGVSGLYEACTDKGDISVEVPAIRDNLDLRSRYGNITASLSPNLAAQLEASASNGKITYKDLPLTVNQSLKTMVTGRLGEGSGKIHIETSWGSITLKKLL